MPALFGLGAMGVGQWNRNRKFELEKQHLALQERIMATQEKERSMRMEQLGLSTAQAAQDWQDSQQLRQGLGGAPQPGAPMGQPSYGAPGVQGPSPEGMEGPGPGLPQARQPRYGEPGVQGPPPEGMEGPGPGLPQAEQPRRQAIPYRAPDWSSTEKAAREEEARQRSVAEEDSDTRARRQQQEESLQWSQPITQAPIGTPQSQAGAQAQAAFEEVGRANAAAGRLAGQARNPQQHSAMGRTTDAIVENNGYPAILGPLARGLLHAETGGEADPATAKSGAGAIGPMQLMPATAKELGVDPHDAVQNLNGGVQYLSQQYKKFGNDPWKALIAYNGGPSTVDTPMPESVTYAKKVLTNTGMSQYIPERYRDRAPEIAAPGAVTEDSQAGGAAPRPTTAAAQGGAPSPALPQLPLPDKLTNPIAPGTQLFQAQERVSGLLRRQRETDALFKERPELGRSPRGQASSANIASEIQTATGNVNSLIDAAVGPVTPELTEYTARQFNGRTPRDVFLRGPSGNGVGGPEAMQALRETLRPYTTTKATIEQQRQITTEAEAKQSVEDRRPLVQVRESDAHTYRNVRTGDPVSGDVPYGEIKAAIKVGEVVKVSPDRTKKLDEVNDLRSDFASLQTRLVEAKDQLAKLRNTVAGPTLTTAVSRDPVIQGYNSELAMFQTRYKENRGMKGKEADAIQLFPHLDADWHATEVLTGAALAGTGAAISLLRLRGGSTTGGSTVGGGLFGGLAGVSLITNGTDILLKATQGIHGITSEDAANVMMDAVGADLQRQTGQLLGQKDWKDPNLRTFVQREVRPVPLQQGQAPSNGAAPQSGQAPLSGMDQEQSNFFRQQQARGSAPSPTQAQPNAPPPAQASSPEKATVLKPATVLTLNPDEMGALSAEEVIKTFGDPKVSAQLSSAQRKALRERGMALMGR